MSYNILNKNVNFQGATQGTIEDVVDTHSNQSISGSKDFLSLSASVGRIANDLTVIGNVSASVNVSASAFYANGTLLGTGGAVSAVANGANNRIATFSSSDALNGEANLTFNGTVLDFKATSISGSGNISGSQFYGNGANLTGVQTALKSNAGLNYDTGELEIKFDTLGTPAGGIDGANDKILIYDNNVSALKQVAANTVANLFSAAVTSYTGDTDNRVLTSGGSKAIVGESTLTFNGSLLALTGDMSGSGYVSASFGEFATKVTAADIELGDATGLAGAGLVDNGGELDIQVSGAVKISGDKVAISGSIADIGLSFNGGVDSINSIKFDPNSLTAASIAVANDSIIIIDADDNQPKKEAFADVVTTMKGNGLTATSGILAVGAGTGIDVNTNDISVDVSDFMSNGVDNRVVTATGTDAMNAEQNLTFDGSLLTIAGTGSATRLRANYTGGGHTDAIFFISGSNTDMLFQMQQQGSGAPTMFLAGESHATYPGVLYNKNKFVNAGAVSQGNVEGGAGSHTRLTVRKTSISDNSATDIITFTVPNANHAASVRVTGVANFDGCAYARVFSFEGVIARASGSPTDKAFSSVSTTEAASITPNFTVAVAGSSNTGANSAQQTFTMQLTIDTSDSSTTNATIMIELINFNDSGITMAAS